MASIDCWDSLGSRWTRWVDDPTAIWPPSDLLAELHAAWEKSKDKPPIIRKERDQRGYGAAWRERSKRSVT